MNILSLIITKVYADVPSVVGVINGVNNPYGSINGEGGTGGGLGGLLANVLRIVFVVAGIIAFLNFVIAGFQYMTAAGDSKALQAAWDRIWQSLLGIILIVGSFALAAIFGQLIFGNPMFMLQPQIFGPK